MNTKNTYTQIKKSIDKADKILLTLHPSPDGDSVGSCLAMYWYLKAIGKTPTLISGDSRPPQHLASLPGFKEIKNKKITQLNLSSFDLLIGLDSSSLDQLTKITKLDFPNNLKTINIDHHDTNTLWADINLVEPNSPAASQILFYLLKTLKVDISSSMAINLFIGMYTDSGGFKYSKTNKDTFFAAANLVEIYPNFSDIIFNLENNETAGRLFFKAIALKNIELYFNDNLAVSSVSQLELSRKNINVQDTEKSNIGNILKTVNGWNIGACLVETETNVCNLSLRTRDPITFNVSKIAQALGGGGHPAAAGAQIKKPLDLAKSDLVAVVEKLYFRSKQV